MSPEHKPRPRIDPGKPFAHFQWNYGWGVWEEVSPEHAGRRGVVTAYAAPSKALSIDDGGDGVPVHVRETRADQIPTLNDKGARTR